MLRIIGDIHGYRDLYRSIVDGTEKSVQVGDLDFEYSWLNEFNAANHRFIPGNHDNYDILRHNPPKHALMDFGLHRFTNKDIPFFFVRGAFSIDREWRTEGVDWWEDEEISYVDLMAVIDSYRMEVPDIVISHDAPFFALERIHGNVLRTRTSAALSYMWDIHKPKLWIFGHHHRNFDYQCATRFICLNEGDYVDLDDNYEVLKIQRANRI